jgi:hypothetical protein
MADRSDIGSGLVYTCNCGWVDRGHVNPEGAQQLLEQIRYESAHPQNGTPAFQVDYEQTMRRWGLESGTGGSYFVRYGLSTDEQNAVALAIFQEVSQRFETLQGTAWPERLRSAPSSFSQEDLVSNLIGFHAAVMGVKADDLIDSLCKPVLKDTAYKIWDRYGSVGDNKNRTWRPVIYPCDECLKALGGKPGAFPK